MKITYYHKKTKLTIEREGEISIEETNELLEILGCGNQNVKCTITWDDGTTRTGKLKAILMEAAPANPSFN